MLPDDEKIELLNDLELDISDCKSCPLFKERKNTIVGNGSFRSDIIIIKDYPEYEEDKKGNAWSSLHSRLFEKMLCIAHFDIRKIYVTYLVHCRPNNNKIYADNIKKCSCYIERLIKIMKPKIIVTCGREVLHYFLGNTKNVSNVRGTFFSKNIEDFGNVLIYPLHHPSTLIKLPMRQKEMIDDLKILFHKMIELGIIIES
jgi:DNA polymerase